MTVQREGSNVRARVVQRDHLASKTFIPSLTTVIRKRGLAGSANAGGA
jgi:hypothetical protein